ncbi:MAG TPA: retroviral-like aspartic protease family protein [Vicinamibacterales bacterium]
MKSYGLEIAVPREARFRSRGVPAIELMASGENQRFYRIHAIVDSGASRTLITSKTAELLGLPDRSATLSMEAAGGAIFYSLARIQFRFPVPNGSPVGIYVDVGVTYNISDNLLGNDVLRYFSILITPSQVIFLADEQSA